jgi:replicative DNA helicase
MQNGSTLTNIEIEQAVLGSLIGDTSGMLWPQVSSNLKAEHFAEPVHARLFEAVASLSSAGKSATPMMLKTYFARDNTLNEIGGVKYLASLVAQSTPRPSPESGNAIA